MSGDYETQYMLDHNSPEEADAINEAIMRHTGYIDFNSGLVTDSQWDDWYDDMRVVSTRFPSTVFILTGKGEGQLDMWKARFIDGKVEEVRAEIIYPAFPNYVVDVDDDECECDLCTCFRQGACEKHRLDCDHCNSGGDPRDCEWMRAI